MKKALYKHGINAAAPIPHKHQFQISPILKNHRSKFNASHNYKTSLNVGEINPIYAEEILPGDTINIDISAVVRGFTPQTAVMDNLFLDIYFFFIPNRISYPFTGDSDDAKLTTNGYSLWHRFLGENTNDKWATNDWNTLTLPQIAPPSEGWQTNSYMDKLGLVCYKKHAQTIDAHWVNAYVAVYNEWFRDQNFQPMIPMIATGFNKIFTCPDGIEQDILSDNYKIENIAYGNCLAPAQKLPDYFTTALPEPQKGSAVGINAQIMTTNDVPVYSGANNPLDIHTAGITLNYTEGTGLDDIKAIGFNTNALGSNIDNAFPVSEGGGTLSADESGRIKIANLHAATSTALQGTANFTINDLRLAFQTQKLLERMARSGTRMSEIYASQWGIHTSDSRLQRPELLGAHRELITNHQVAQTSENNTTNLGTIAAYTHKAFCANNKIIKSFSEHGIILGVAIARYEHSYNQGIERKFTRHTILNFYNPVFQGIGEQIIYNYEIFANGDSNDENKIFGYKAPWDEYRYKKNKTTGLMRPNAKDKQGNSIGLGMWNYADDYDEKGPTPILSQAWLMENRFNVDRTLGITDKAKIPAYQLYADIQFQEILTREISINGIPGYIDHY